MTNARRLSLVAALLGCALLVASCMGWSRYDSDFEAAPPKIRDDWTLVKQHCSGCHEVDRVFFAMQIGKISDRGDIEWVVEDMISRGARIPDDDYVRVVDVLEWHLNQ